MGGHDIRLSIIPHDGLCSIPDAARAGSAFNEPMDIVGTDIHDGRQPPRKSFVEVMTPNVMLAAIKRAEDSDDVIVRLYEVAGKDTQARVRISDIVKPGSIAHEVDLREQPIQQSSARMDNDTLVVSIPAYGIASVAIAR